MAHLSEDRYRAEFEAEIARIGALTQGLNPRTPLPTCPQWTLRDLVTHIGTGHRWAAEIVEGGLDDPPEYELIVAPDDPAAWPKWLANGAGWLSDAVGAAEGPVWTWRADRTAEFWLRKMVHDALIHRVDVELARGEEPGDIDPVLAADGVTDLLETISTLSAAGGRTANFTALAGQGQTLHFHATDPDLGEAGEWVATRTPTGVTWRSGHEKADVAVRADAVTLLLVLNRRLGPEHVEILGDSELFTQWLDRSAF